MNTSPKKRTLGDDFRDYLNGKIENKYYGGVRREFAGISKTKGVGAEKRINNIRDLDTITDENGKVTGFKEKNENNNRLSGSSLPLAGDEIKSAQERALNKRKNDPATVPSYEQYIQRLADTYVVQTVPSKEQIQQYNADSKLLFEGDMQEKYNGADYNTLMNASDKTESYREKQWLKSKAQEVATSSDLQGEKDVLIKQIDELVNEIETAKPLEQDKLVKQREELQQKLYNLEVNGIDTKIKNKKSIEDAEEFEKWKNKYEGYTYEELLTAQEQAIDDKEKQRVKDYAYEIGNSEELIAHRDKLKAEYDKLYSEINSYDDKKHDEALKHMMGIEDELEVLDGKIKNKKYEEDKQEKYNNVIQNDVKAYTTLQKYYALQKADETEKLLNDTGASIEDIKTSSAGYYNYAKNLSEDEKAQIVSDFENLKNQGYDVGKLYKYFSREEEEKLTDEQNKILTDYAQEHPALGSAASVGLNLGGGVADAAKYIGTEIDSKFNNGDGYINPENTNVYRAQMVRDTVSEDMGGLGKFLYSTGMSMADFLSTAAISAVPGGQAVGLALLGTSAGVSAANDVIESGGDIDHAVMTGLAAGIAETVFEKFSLEQLKAFKQGDVNSVKDFVKNLINGSFTEGTEEAFTDIANAITDQIINGDMSQLSRQYNEYLANGMSEREAWWKTAVGFGEQTMLDFAGGALSGGVMSGGAMAINLGGAKINRNKNVRQIGEAAMDREDFDIDGLINAALNTDKGSKAYKMGKSMQKEKDSGNSKALYNPVNVGILLKLTDEEYRSGKVKKVSQQTQNKKTANSAVSANNIESENSNTVVQTENQNKNENYTDIKTYARKVLKSESAENREAIIKLLSPFGTKNENGVVANILENGKKIGITTVKSIESSSHNHGEDNNKIMLRLKDNTVVSADNIMIHDHKIQQLVKNAAEFETMGAGAYVRAYEDYEKYAGNKADMTRYSEDFSVMYNVGRTGIKYDTFIESGQLRAILRSIGNDAARQAIFAGNLDSDYRYRHPKNRLLKVDGVKGNVTVADGTEFDMDGNAEVLNLLGSLSKKTGRDIVITNTLNSGIKGQFNPRTGKIYISSEIKSTEMLSIALHEAGHSIKISAPNEWRELEKFVVNYLTSQNKNVSRMIEEQMAVYRASGQILINDTALEEIVCNTLMSLASDEKALQTAIKSTDKNALQKIASAIKKIVAKIKSWLSDRNAISAEAYKPFMNDINALMTLAEKFEKAAESGKGVKVEQKNNTGDNSDVKNSSRIKYAIDDKREPYNGYSYKTIKKLISKGQEFSKKYSTLNELLYSENVSFDEWELIALGYENPNYIPQIGTFYRIGEPILDIHKGCYRPSYNFAEDRSEEGVSVVTTKWLNSLKSIFWGADDEKIKKLGVYKITGVILPYVGGDDEITIFPLDYAKKTYIKTRNGLERAVKALEKENNFITHDENDASEIKYAIDDIIDNNRDLVAIHNLSADNLLKSINLGGFAMPSIAITKSELQHSDYGKISLVFSKDTIDPESDKSNEVYSGDAWTPTFPRIEYKINERKSSKIYDKLYNLFKDNNIERLFSSLDIDDNNIEYYINNRSNWIQTYRDKSEMKLAYLLDSGKPINMPYKESLLSPKYENDIIIKTAKTLGFDVVEKGLAYSAEATKLTDEINAIVDEYYSKEIGKSIHFDLGLSDVDSILHGAYKYLKYGNNKEIDTYALEEEIKKTDIDEKDYYKWIDNLFDGIIEKKGIRNNRDLFTSSGNRRSFESLHYEVTLENVVKAMKDEDKKGAVGLFGGSQFYGSSTKNYKSVNEIKKNEKRLQSLSEDEYDKIRYGFNERLSGICKELNPEAENSFMEVDNTASIICDAVKNRKTKSGIKRYLSEYQQLTVNDEVVDKIISLVNDIRQMPVKYFEAKPRRAVSFDEVKAAIIPADTDIAVKDALKQLGVPMYEYDSNNENSRAEVTQKAINTEYIDINGEKHSDLRFAIDDEYGMFDDLFEGETEEQKAERWHEEFDNYLKYNPEQALMMTYNASAKTAEQAIKVTDVVPEDKRVDRAIKKVWEKYSINANSEKLAFGDFKKALNEYVTDVRDDKISYGESFENLVMACKESLQFSALEDHSFDDFRAGLKEICKNGLVLNEYEEGEIKEIYGNVARYRNSLFGKCTVRLERNIKSVGGNKTGQYIDDIIAELQNKFGEMIPVDMHSLEGLQWFEQIVNKYWQPQYINPYIDGYSEEINTAAIQMAYDMSSAYIAEMSKQIVSNEKADKQQLREITRLARISKDEIQQLAKTKEIAVKESYRKKLADEKERYDKKIKRLNDNLKNERMQGLKRAARTEQQIFKLRKQRTQLEEQNKKQRTIIANEFTSIRDNYLEKKRATMLRNRLGRMLNSMSKRLDGKANNNEYIPESLKQPILDVLSSFAVDPGRTKYGKQKAVPGYYGEYRKINEIGDAVTRLARRYSAIDKGNNKNQEYAFIDIEGLAYKDNVMKALNELSELLSGRNVYQLDVYDLEAVVDTMELLDQTLKDAVTVIIDGQKMQFQEAATKAVDEIGKVHFSKDVQRFGNDKLNNVLSTPRELRNAYVATHLDPVRYGKFLSGYHEDSVTYKIFNDLHAGDKKRIRIMESAMLEVQRTLVKYEDKEIKSLQKDDISEFDLRDIETRKRAKITQGVLLAIYLTDKQADGHRHLINDQWNSYTVIPDVDYMNNPINDLKGKNSSGDKFHKVRLTEADIEHIKRYVEENSLLKDLAKSISSVYNEMLPEEINAVSMAKYGKRIATVKNYYPLKVYTDGAKFSDKNFEAEFNDIRMKSRGFTKQREFSYAPIMVDDVLRTFRRQVNSVSEWCGLLIPIENFKKIYNSGNGMNTLHEIIVKKFGGSAEHYIEKLMGDLQKQRDSIDDNMFMKIQQKYMGAVLMLNPGAAVKQMAAFPLANKYFGHINVAKSTVMGAVKGKELCEVYSKYTPYLWYRKEGNGTIVGETSRQAGFYGKATDVLDVMGKMDRYVVNSMLYAAEQHIKKTTDLKPGTEEFYKEVARLYEKVVDESQPNNMITSKPQFVRNNVLKTLSMNAFMSQTMAMGNGIIDSFMEWRARAYDYKTGGRTAEGKVAKNNAAKKFLQHCVGVLESAALLSLLSLISAFGYHKWDDFKDENGDVTFGKITKNMFEYFLDGVFGSFAWGKRIYEFIDSMITGDTYYGLEVMSLSNINDIATDVLNGNYMSLATMLGDCIGLPASNAYRIAKSVSAYVNDIMYGNGNIIISNKGFNNVNFDNLPSMLVTALQKGDKDKAEYYEDMLKEHLMNDKGKSEKEAVDTIKGKIVLILSDTDEVGEIAKFKYNGELEKYESRLDKVVKQGFDSVDVKKAVDKAINNVKTDMKENGINDEESAIDWLMNQGFNEQAAKRIWKATDDSNDSSSQTDSSAFDETSEMDESTKYAYDDLWNALLEGDDELYNVIYKGITTADGKLTDKNLIAKKQKAAVSAMKNASRTDKLWAEYIEAVRGSDPARVKELRNIFVKIYGSWDKAMEALNKYKKKQK